MTPSAYQRLLRRLAPGVRDQFLAAVQDLADADARLLTRAIDQGDTDTVLEILDLDESTFSGFEQALDQAHDEAGQAELRSHRVPSSLLLAGIAGSFIIRFRRGRRERISGATREVVDTAREEAQRVVESVKQGELSAAQGARRLVGRPELRRLGGVVGLPQHMMEWSDNAADDLTGVPSLRYFTRRRRDRRFDSPIRRAIAEDRPLNNATRERAVAAYRRRLKVTYAQTVGRTAVTGAVNLGRYTAIQQLIDRGLTRPDLVTVTWQDMDDARVRNIHQLLDDTEILYGETFVSPETGARMRYPADKSLGARGADVENCRCFARNNVRWRD